MRDYKDTTSRPSRAGGAARRPAPARKSSAKPRPAAAGPGGWLWLSTGLAAGLFIALLLFLNGGKNKDAPDLRLDRKVAAPAVTDHTRLADRRPLPVAHPRHRDPDVEKVLEENLPPPELKATHTDTAAPTASSADNAQPDTGKSVAPTGKGHQTGKAHPEQAAASVPNYEFYELLPHMQVEVPADALDTSPPPPGTFAADAQPADTNAPAEGAAPKEHMDVARAESRPGSRFILQAGAFRNQKEAAALSAKLAGMGLPSSVEVVDLPGNDRIYRVRSGPYYKNDDAQHAMQRAQSSGARVILIKEP